ncbi:hypothetical protein EVAR_99181_1 [Eumeta japonica]|uniref:Uncharacterized protein n=1 Tax=Eumeta variegata TaxID=151549 RepID=A0A4C1YUT0_EUMVA|nr:hypothetical protein EVAR_99181_1 [Eumeta japonica]
MVFRFGSVACESVMTSQSSPYYQNGASDQTGYYEHYEQTAIFARQPGPELLIAKQNALSAQTQLWQNTAMKRPFFYTESPHYNGAQFMHTRYEAHPQEIADSHIHQGTRSVKTTNTTSLSGPLSCNGQRATKTFLRQPQTTTDRHACQISQTNHHQHYPNSYRQASNNGDL